MWPPSRLSCSTMIWVEHRVGQVVAGLGVVDDEVLVVANHLGQIVQRHVGAGLGIVETPVRVLLDDDRLFFLRLSVGFVQHRLSHSNHDLILQCGIVTQADCRGATPNCMPLGQFCRAKTQLQALDPMLLSWSQGCRTMIQIKDGFLTPNGKKPRISRRRRSL